MKYIIIFFMFFSFVIFSLEPNESQISKLSSEQKISKASAMISKMEATLNDAYSILKKTRKEKDVVKLNCVNESIRKIKGLLKRSKDDFINLQESIAKADTKSINYYYTKISLASGNIKQAGVEALSCTGTITIEAHPVIDVTVEELVVNNDYSDDDAPVSFEKVSNVELEPILASPYF